MIWLSKQKKNEKKGVRVGNEYQAEISDSCQSKPGKYL